MEMSAKEWLTVLGLIDRLRWMSDMHGTMLTVLLLRLEQAGTLSASQRAAIEAAWDDVFNIAEGVEFLPHEPRDPRAQKRVVLTETGVVSSIPVSLHDQLESEFDDILQQASVTYRGELGQREEDRP